MSSSTRVLVRRASHAHHVPQIGLPQIAPVASVSAVNSTPTVAAARATASKRRSLRHSTRIEAPKTTKYAR